MICGGGVELTDGLSMLAVDFRLPIPKPLKREFREFIRERKGQRKRGKEEKTRQEGEKGRGGISEVEEE